MTTSDEHLIRALALEARANELERHPERMPLSGPRLEAHIATLRDLAEWRRQQAQELEEEP